MSEKRKLTAKQRIAARWDWIVLPSLFLVTIVIFSVISPVFRTPYNIISNIKFTALVGIAAIGMAFVIMTGDFDISIGSMLALSGVIGASLAPSIMGWAVLIVILIATAFGFVNGIFVTKLRIPAFITTLGMLFIYRAFAFIYSNNAPIYIKDRFWLFLGNGDIAGIPFPIILMLFCFLIGYLLLRKTPFGRFVLAVGSRKEAARLSGISVDAIKLAVFTLLGFFVGISSIIHSANLGSANPGLMGQDYEFQVITVVVLGGTALSGGSGNLIGAFFAALIITFLRNGLGIVQVNSYWQFVATGAVLIFAVALNRLKYALLGQRETQ